MKECANFGITVLCSTVTTWETGTLSSSPDIICLKYTVPVSLRLELDYVELVKSLNFDHFFERSARYTAYFGDVPYTYGGTTHSTHPIESNVYIYKAKKLIKSLFPVVDVNSVLVNYYPRSSSFLPFHADDESEIAASSFIVTLSLGSSRQIAFRRKSRGPVMCKVMLESWDLLFFSKSSQSYFLHSIVPGMSSPGPDSSRISLTFRYLNNVDN